MNRRKLASLLGVAIVASQAGHLLAYAIRFGPAALQIQSAGAHAYFPSLLKTGFGLVAGAVLAALFLIGAGRLLAGRRIAPASAPSLLRLLAAMFTIQLASYVGQETAEAALTGVPASSADVLLLWGTAGQLPVALAAAIAFRWLLARLEPALAAISLGFAPLYQRLVYALATFAWPLATDAAAVARGVASGFNRRGPPSYLAVSS